ncbi:winged helix-turn-helix domain-containing protein [Rugamonas sp. CCM 8940]|uniref:winged helix-turn-helix domain-containing protein n=1 Tax=Rugamonas sp. CCM 8940 TaxID=2765359 RepID=UPI00351C2EC6
MHAIRQTRPAAAADTARQEPRDGAARQHGKLALVERPALQPLQRAPLSMAPIERVRSTSATLRRIENMQKLIGELSMHEMLADEIAWFLKFSPSGARKYIRDLREAGVIELARYIEGTATYLGKAVYQLTPDPDRVRAFLAAIVQPKREGAPPRKERPGLREQHMAGSGRHFHILADDTHYAIRVNRGPVMRDPLVAALFGSAPSQQKEQS